VNAAADDAAMSIRAIVVRLGCVIVTREATPS
jgi:hypothetical protein